MREIPRFPNYCVTIGGRVWSKPRRDRLGRHQGEKWLAPTPHHKSGHLSVMLTKNKKHHRCFVHHLVLETFIGPRPNGMECRHLDGNPTNNRLDNLKWGTHSENELDKIKHGTHFSYLKGRCGELATGSKLSNWDRCVILFDYLTEEFSQATLGRRYGLTDVAINHLVHGRTWPFIDIHSILKGNVV